MELFVEPVVFEKLSAEAALSEDPSTWTHEILQEVFKQAPFVADFEPRVVLDRVDGERGYGFGHVEISNKTEIEHGAPEEAMQAAGVRSARVPIIVRDRMLQPLDVLVTENSDAVPLTEARLRQALFRPQAFDITARTPGDMSIIGQLYPPFRQNYGFGGGGAVMTASMGKEGSNARSPSLLRAVLPLSSETTYRGMLCQLEDERVRAAFVKNADACHTALRLLFEHDPVPLEKTARALAEHVRPDVVQLIRENEAYRLKSASTPFWAVREERIARPEAIAMLGTKVVLAADLSGSATLTQGDSPAAAGANVIAEPEEEAPSRLVTEFGVYRVEDLNGRILTGYVFPSLLDIDGTALPVALFANGTEAAVQGEIVGAPAPDGGGGLAEGHPRGHGSFYRIVEGRGEATLPLTIRASLSEFDRGGVAFLAETFDGRHVEVHVAPSVARVVGAENAMLVPADMRWLPLDDAKETVLASVPTKTASAKRFFDSVVVRGDEAGCFSFDGAPVWKLGSSERSLLSTDEACFLLGALGVTPDLSAQKLAEAATGMAPVTIPVTRSIEPAHDSYRDARKLASAQPPPMPHAPSSLIKMAAVIPDPVAVDTVLSLGFLSAENLATFIDYLPHIDEAQKHMCELLLAARLGLRDLPLSAVEKAVRATEEVLEGLKVIAFHK